MTLKLSFIWELGVVIAAYLLARIRFALRQVPSLSDVVQYWVPLVALAVGVVAGMGFAHWTTSENQKASDSAEISAALDIDGDQNGYELAVVDLVTSIVHNGTAAPVALENRHNPSAIAATIANDYPEESAGQSHPESNSESSGQLALALSRQIPESPAWQRFAVTTEIPSESPMIAIVVDDLGVNVRNAARTISLPGPLTLAFMSYARNLQAQTETARAAGHELMLHLPMEPQDRTADPGPNVLLTRLPVEENLRRLRWALERFEGYIGVNNHMGSRFTQDEEGMALVMNELSARGLMFLDSRTARGSVSGPLARRYGVPIVGRDVFLDNVPKADQVRSRLDELETIARIYGRAIGIAHPHKGTIEALEAWLPSLNARGLTLVPLSAFLLQPPGSG